MPVEIEERDGVVVVRLAREEKRNAIDAEMTAAIDGALNAFEDDDAALVAIVTGGPPVFCAGTDIASGSGRPTERGGEYGIIRRRSPKPIIAAVEGIAFGGGFEIAMACDLIVASRDARFGLPEVRRGLVATSAGLFRAPQLLPVNVARELLLTGEPMGVDRAERLGIVNRVTPAGGALEGALELAAQIVAGAPTSIRETLAAVNDLVRADDDAGWAATDRARRIVWDSADRQEGVTAFFERRTPDWPGR